MEKGNTMEEKKSVIVDITDPALIQIIKDIFIFSGKDMDGDIVHIEGHKFFAHILKDIYQEIDPIDKPLSTKAWVVADVLKDVVVFALADTRDEAINVIYNDAKAIFCEGETLTTFQAQCSLDIREVEWKEVVQLCLIKRINYMVL